MAKKNRRARPAATLPVLRPPSPREVSAFRRQILAWFRRNGRHFPWRKHHATPYQLILPELLLQRTRADVVAAYLPQFMKHYPSWSALAHGTEEELGEFLRPLGLWRRRASSLFALARELAARRGRFPRHRMDIEALPGVGQYIANAIALFAFHQPQPLLDVNMARVLERCFGARRLADIRYDPQLQGTARLIVAGSESAYVNWAILDLAALVCRKSKPLCRECPLRKSCAHVQQVLEEASRG